MRRGLYAVVDGVEYAAKRNENGLSIFIYHIGKKPDGRGRAGPNRWYRVVDASEVSEAFEVMTRAWLDDVEVYVDSVNP